MKSKCLIITILFVICVMIFNAKVNAETSAFSLEKDSVDVVLNGTQHISYSGGTGTVTWTSADISIATVDNYGIVKGLKIGETTITATCGDETATCKIKVVYNSIQIGANESKSVTKVNLVLNEHDSENLTAIVKDNDFKDVSNATINWKSSDSSVVTIDANSGKMNAVKVGTATITAESAGVSDTCEVIVYDAPDFTDFKNAKYETSLSGYTETLKISGVTPKDSIDYYYIITSSNAKPELVTKYRKYR